MNCFFITYKSLRKISKFLHYFMYECICWTKLSAFTVEADQPEMRNI